MPWHFPPTSSCHLCAWQTFPERPLELPGLAATALPSVSHHEKLRAQIQLCHRGPSALVPLLALAEKGALHLPRWL